MRMIETVRSLRAYFILSGLAEIWSEGTDLVSILRSPISFVTILVTIFALVAISLSLAFLYVGMFLPGLLRTASGRIVMLLYISAGWLVVSSIPAFWGDDRRWAIVFLVMGLLIIWYLLRNVQRLALEMQNATPPT